MDYKDLINILRRAPNTNIGMTPVQPLEWDAADAITDLLARAEAAEDKIKQMTPCVNKGITASTIPLTLEQLREIYGQPVWVKSLINDNPGEWCILRAIQRGKGRFLSFSGSQHVYGDQAEYGKTWIAYAYPSAQIDREAWKPCRTCEDDNCGMCVNAGTYRHFDPCDKCDDEDSQYESANFCPKCGRPLTDEAWDMLKKRLRRMKNDG